MKKLLIFLAALSAFGQKVDYVQQTRNKPTFDVREYGAKCNGTDNDSTAIASALTAALAVRGGSGCDIQGGLHPAVWRHG